MIENAEIMLQYRSLSLEELFANLSLSSNYNLLLFIKEINKQLSAGKDYEALYEDAIEDILLTKTYDNEDRSYMRGFLSMLGKSDVSGQIANCKMYKELFKIKLDALQNNENSKCKSMSALIMGVGIMISLIIV